MEIIEIDVLDEDALRRFQQVEQASLVDDRPHQISRSFSALADVMRTPSRYLRSALLGAVDDGQLVCVAELAISLQDNLHLADCEIHVLPAWRRREVGGALYAGIDRRRRDLARTVVCGEVHVVAGGRDVAGVRVREVAGLLQRPRGRPPAAAAAAAGAAPSSRAPG